MTFPDNTVISFAEASLCVSNYLNAVLNPGDVLFKIHHTRLQRIKSTSFA
jgi:hypothetical protein